MSVGDTVTLAVEALVALGIPGGIVWYVRDRRKSRAEAAVAERTVGAQVDQADTGAADARLAYVQRQMDLERDFHAHQVADRDAEIHRQRAELAHRDQVIAELREEVADLQRRLAELTVQLSSVHHRLGELAEHHPGPAPQPRSPCS